MPLDEVRLRLRPLISDPDDPLYPGSPDAPTLASFVTPVPAPAAAPGDSMAVPRVAPLAADPGPLPAPARPPAARPPAARPAPPPPRPTRRPEPATPAPSVERAVALVVAGALVVLLGAAAGWTVTRMVGGQSPLSTVTVTSAGTELVSHLDRLGFDVDVPRGWAEFPYEAADGQQAVSFISPDGTEELTVSQAASALAATAAVTPEQLGVALVGEPEVDGDRLRYRTERDGQERSTWMQVVPITDGAWVLRLTVPGDRDESSTTALFDVLVGGFSGAGV
jgi:hypothetical protein